MSRLLFFGNFSSEFCRNFGFRVHFWPFLTIFDHFWPFLIVADYRLCPFFVHFWPKITEFPFSGFRTSVCSCSFVFALGSLSFSRYWGYPRKLASCLWEVSFTVIRDFVATFWTFCFEFSILVKNGGSLPVRNSISQTGLGCKSISAVPNGYTPWISWFENSLQLSRLLFIAISDHFQLSFPSFWIAIRTP